MPSTNEDDEQDVGEENDCDAHVHDNQVADVPWGDTQDPDDHNRAIKDVEKTEKMKIRRENSDDRVMREFKWYEIDDKETENVVLEFQVIHVVASEQLPFLHILPREDLSWTSR